MSTPALDSLLKSPFHEAHVARGARMVEFAGWLLPLSFAGVTEEHAHTRTSCSAFDVSHMGRLRITGGDSDRFLNYVCTRKLAGADVGRCYYSHVCREDGGILDDVIVSRFESDWCVVCNGSNREKVVGWLNRHAVSFDVSVQDATMATAMLAIQGPRAIEAAEAITGRQLANLKRYHCTTYEFMGMRIDLFRSGYTGEDGLEVVIPANAAMMLMPYVVGGDDAPHPVVRPAGLAARDTLRIEAGMPLYGHELSEDVDPLSAGQGWCVDLSQDFVGAEALRELKQAGLKRRIAGLELEGRRIARQHYKVHAGGREIGEITSGTLSPTLGKSIAMALVLSEYADENTKVDVYLKDKPVAATVVKLPFYKREQA